MNKIFKPVLTLLFAIAFAMTTTVSAFAQEVNVVEDNLPISICSKVAVMPMSGVETFYSGTRQIGSFSLVGSNLTPVKTIGNSGNFTLHGTASGNGYFCVRVQIREYPSGRVLCSTTTDNPNNGIAYYTAPTIWLNQGQKIQIYMDYITAPAQSANIVMYYSLQ